MALLCVGLQGLVIGHLLLAQHVVCPLHGELIHADASVEASATASPASDTLAVRAAHDQRDVERTHEHCAVRSTRRDGAVITARQQVVIVASPCLGVPAPDTTGLAPMQARHCVAPKQSPPA